MGEDRKWYWRNCRSLALSFDLSLWPWYFTAGRSDYVDGGERWIAVGPFALTLSYDIGNCSSENRLIAWTGLSEDEAWERAGRYAKEAV